MLRGICSALCVVVAVSAAPVVAATPLVQETPALGTPHVLDRSVRATAAVGNQIVLGGDFTQAQNDGSATVHVHRGLLSFDRSTMQLTPLSLPLTGTVHALAPAGGDRVFVGGSFTVSAGGVRRTNLALVDLGSRSVVASFKAGAINGPVKDLKLVSGKLWVAGGFSSIRKTLIRGLATLSPRTGAVTGFTKLSFGGRHKSGETRVQKIAVTPDRKRLFAVGNFATVAGQRREQFAVLGIGGRSAHLLRYRTRFFQGSCPSNNDSYTTDIDTSPDGRYVVVVTSGGLGSDKSPCDGAFRFETNLNGTNVRPSWISHTGGDSITSVEIADGAVYVGGHFRFFNNPYSVGSSEDAEPGPGATARKGLAALDPANGMPLQWNPTRERGEAVYDFLLSDQGLWVASDTEAIGPGEPQPTHKRIALLPAGGLPVGVPFPASLPGNVYITGAFGAVQNPGLLYRINAGGAALPPTNAIGWAVDTKTSPSPHHLRGAEAKKRPRVKHLASNVAAGTPTAVFANSLVGTEKHPSQSWNLRVRSGEPLVVRLYFARPCTCKGVSTWSQAIRIDDRRRLKQLNVAKAAGGSTGIMRSFLVTPGDGTLDIDLLARRGRTSLAALEVLTQTPKAAITSTMVRRPATAKAFGGLYDNPVEGPNWGDLRGAFMLGGQLYTAWADGTFTRQSFDGTSVGAPTTVVASDEIVPLNAWKSDAASATSMFYDAGRIYFTLPGSSQLYYRYFTASTEMVGATRHIAVSSSPPISYAAVRGAFLAGSTFYWATNDGALRQASWARIGPKGTPVASTARVVSGVGVDSHYWLERVLFLGP